MQFHKNHFLSGSMDGLISVFDVTNGLDEDEGFLVRSSCLHICAILANQNSVCSHDEFAVQKVVGSAATA